MSEPFLLKASNISCGYGEKRVAEDISFHLHQGEIASLLGPSGCGKTTLLRVLAGFQPVFGGSIELNGKVLSSEMITLPPEKRQVGMVFQDYALFPHMTVGQNIRFGLTKHNGKLAQADRILSEMLELTGLSSYTDAYPHELSGGQQQRVALARALAPDPLLLLMDEPFSNLDAELRSRLSLDIRDILKKRGTTAILVTHDQNEAFAMADHVGILHNGTLQQWDTPYNLYHEPSNRFVANFVGRGVLIPGTMIEPDKIKTELGEIGGDRAYPWDQGELVEVLIRPDDVVFDERSGLKVKVIDKVFAGSSTLYRLQLPSSRKLEILAPSHQDYPVAGEVAIRLAADHLIAFRI
ncbi:iron ABC transporter ATP-binding protein [Hahella sp. CCB-MM4]|uniref:ABC transporter ATP-binding protein n=1 Tax=Hahella sp. (strain CCB-MM4) TaxID=1926491 RepID=UPI000B9C3039|nr:ABC transporter ATP-binding protein [Hahella sp. CCB-MM4]OZG70655.1 iron ABC transporter ATP-binding protein [Hahella sp. CCB-MM4]